MEFIIGMLVGTLIGIIGMAAEKQEKMIFELVVDKIRALRN